MKEEELVKAWGEIEHQPDNTYPILYYGGHYWVLGHIAVKVGEIMGVLVSKLPSGKEFYNIPTRELTKHINALLYNNINLVISNPH